VRLQPGWVSVGVGAASEVSELREASAALGLGPGEPGSNDRRAVAAAFRRVRGDPALKRICDLAGRFRRVAQSRQRRKVSHGQDEVVGVEPGGDLARVLPSELVKLAEQLQDDLIKEDRHVLSIATLKKTEDIEKLARKIRTRLRR